jgi:hypothetical protein
MELVIFLRITGTRGSVKELANMWHLCNPQSHNIRTSAIFSIIGYDAPHIITAIKEPGFS